MHKSFFSRVILVPSVVWLSVFFGASTGSGRELVEYITPAGPWGGIVSVVAVTISFAVALFLCFEIARRYNAYDYRVMSKLLLGKAWPIYEVVLLLGMLLALAIASTASGELLSKRFDLPKLWGTGALLLLVVLSVYKGRVFIEKSMTIAVAALLAAFLYIGFKVAGNNSALLVESFSASKVHFNGVSTALQYAMVNLSYIPLILYAARGIRTRSESATGAISAAIFATIPLFFLHIIFIAGYPEILSEELPIYWLLKRITSDWFVDIYVAILFLLIVQTGVGLLQGFIERIDGWFLQRKGKSMSSNWNGLLSFGVMASSLLLSSIGLIDLIRGAYMILFMGFIVTFVIPLITVGSYRIFKSDS